MLLKRSLQLKVGSDMGQCGLTGLMREWQRKQTDRYDSETPNLAWCLPTKVLGNVNNLDCALRVALDFGSSQLRSKPLAEFDRAGKGKQLCRTLREPI
jgi:hypothetical protein